MFEGDGEQIQQTSSLRPARREPALSDLELRSSRDFLVGLLENTWSEVGWGLRNLASAADIPKVLRPWESSRDLHAGVRALLRPVIIGPPEPSRSVARKRYNDAVRAILRTQGSTQQYLEVNQKADRALLLPTSRSKRQRKKIRKVKIALKVQLDKTNAEPAHVNTRLSDHKETLLDAYASFAQGELLHFCRSARYRLTPLNTANALAGLPTIGFRQAVKRTVKWECTLAGGYAYQMFLAIRELVNTWNLGTDLKAHAERKLNSRRKSVSRPLAELREHWPQLSLALGSIQKGHTLAEMPFRITSVYFQKKNHISPTDALFIEAKRLGVLS